MSQHLARRAPALSFQCEHLALRPGISTPRAPLRLALHPRHDRSASLHTTAILSAGTNSSSRAFRSANSARNPSPKYTAAKQIAAALRSGEGLNEDVGLLPETIVLPRAVWAWRYRGLWGAVLRQTAVVRGKELLSALLYGFWKVRPRPAIEWRSVAGTAERLHREMYEAFAAGELEAVKGTVCAGLWRKLEERVRKRPAGVRLRWKVERHVRRPKVMSFKAGLQQTAATASKEEQLGIKQAVVRIHSVQSLQHVKLMTVRDETGYGTSVKEVVVDAMGKPLEEGEKAAPVMKESVEYLVVQKLLIHSQEKGWKIWGTTQETPLEFFTPKPVKKLSLSGSESGQGPMV
nr:hypothetical protein CFP56_20611 [Quercus suber]